MKIALFSDLHTEFHQDIFHLLPTPEADVCVLAGDIAVGPVKLLQVLNFYSAHYENVIYVTGNHEYYKHTLAEIDTILTPSNVHFLNPGHVTIKDVTFIGANLWTNFQNDFFAKHAAKDLISDFRLIRGFSVEKCAALHEMHISYIKQAYEVAAARKMVVVTHFLPAVECTHPRFRGDSPLNNYFANDYGSEIADMSNTTWVFGHTHDPMDFMLGDTRMLCNPRGYPGEGNTFNPGLVIEI